MSSFFSNLSLEQFGVLFTIITGLVGVIFSGFSFFYKNKIESIQDLHKIEIENLKRDHNLKQSELHQSMSKEQKSIAIKSIANDDIVQSERLDLPVSEKPPLRQEIKMVYVKYLYINKEGNSIYKKYIERLGEEIDVFSECTYYRFNKFNSDDNCCTITDKSSGIVDYSHLFFPWKKIFISDLPSVKLKGVMTQEVTGQRTYLSVANYYNGFKKGDADIGMKMELDTDCARIVVDFSSVFSFDNLFTKEPDAYKFDFNGNKIKLFSLEKIERGIYHLEAHDLKRGETIFIVFNVNWEHLNRLAWPKTITEPSISPLS